MPATNIDESMLSQLKGKNSIDPPHFPYFVVVDKNLKVLKVLNGVEDVIAMLQSSGTGNASASTEVQSLTSANAQSLTSANAQSATSANASASTSVQPSASMSVQPSASANAQPSASANAQSSANSATSSKVSANSSKSKLVSINNEEEEEEPEMAAVSIIPNANGRPASVSVSPVNSTSVPGVGKNSSLALPPIAKNDQASTSNTRSSAPSIGGSLYSSLASTAYQLAPPAILMGIAAATLQKRSRKRKARKSKVTRRRR